MILIQLGLRPSLVRWSHRWSVSSFLKYISRRGISGRELCQLDKDPLPEKKKVR